MIVKIDYFFHFIRLDYSDLESEALKGALTIELGSMLKGRMSTTSGSGTGMLVTFEYKLSDVLGLRPSMIPFHLKADPDTFS